MIKFFETTDYSTIHRLDWASDYWSKGIINAITEAILSNNYNSNGRQTHALPHTSQENPGF
jgi:hypothetical protein